MERRFEEILDALSTLFECTITLVGSNSTSVCMQFDLDEGFVDGLPYASPMLCAEQIVDHINNKVGMPSVRKLQQELEKAERYRQKEKKAFYEETEELRLKIVQLEKYKMFYEMFEAKGLNENKGCLNNP
jgi:hypothetical protein